MAVFIDDPFVDGVSVVLQLVLLGELLALTVTEPSLDLDLGDDVVLDKVHL